MTIFRARLLQPALAVVLCCAAAGVVAIRGGDTPEPTDWTMAGPDYRWSFPGDHWAHRDYRTEWWYFTGHLECADDPAQRFGYQFTFFRIGLQRSPPVLDSGWEAATLIMGHGAITDLAGAEHRFSDLLRREVPLLGSFGRWPEPIIAWALPPAGTGGAWSLRYAGVTFEFEMRDQARGIGFRLSALPVKPVVLQGPNGLSRKGERPGAASLYYSHTRMSTSGTLTFDERICDVRGVSWMDREFGSHQLGEEQTGWDWFGLQLVDGRDLMLYSLRRADGGVDFRNGTLISARGEARHLSSEEWTVRSTATWKSPVTDTVYPARWVIEVPGEDLWLDVKPFVRDQENRGRVPSAPFYYEGAVEVRDEAGKPRGRGYVELTGYGRDNRPPI